MDKFVLYEEVIISGGGERKRCLKKLWYSSEIYKDVPSLIEAIEAKLKRQIKESSTNIKDVRVIHDGESFAESALNKIELDGVKVEDTIVIEIEFS